MQGVPELGDGCAGLDLGELKAIRERSMAENRADTEALSALRPTAVFLTTVAVVAGWLLVEVWVFTRLRIGAYDTEYVPPSGAGAAP